MGDLLKADMDGQDAAATAVSAAAATLGSSAVRRASGASGSEAGATAESAAADAGHSESGSAAGGLEASRSDAADPPMTLAFIGWDLPALDRVVRTAQDLHSAAESVRGMTGTTGEQEAAAVRLIVLEKTLDWHGSVKDVDEILQLSDITMRYVGTPVCRASASAVPYLPRHQHHPGGRQRPTKTRAAACLRTRLTCVRTTRTPERTRRT